MNVLDAAARAYARAHEERCAARMAAQRGYTHPLTRLEAVVRDLRAGGMARAIARAREIKAQEPQS